jgi:urea carboxylase-associated protein 2
MTSNTADPNKAKAHARAMGSNMVEAMPKLPPSAPFLWEETISAGGYGSRRIKRGTRIELTDISGDACVSILLFNAECAVERLNVADTVKVQWNAYIGQGQLLLSDMGRVMASIIEDNAGTHDCFCGASNAASNIRQYGHGANYSAAPNARDRFLIALAKYGMGRKDIHPCVNLFKGVMIAEDGGIMPNIGPFEAGRRVTLRAEMDMILVIANCPHVLDTRNEYSVTPVKITAKTGPVASDDDPIRIATPEGLRAYLNTEDYYRR